MKIFKLILAFTMPVILYSCSQDKRSMTVTTEIPCDHCENCESCEPRVENALKATEGVLSADMKVSEQTISVSYNPSKTDEQKIKKAIAMTGFDAGDVKADPAAYDNLDDCCKRK